MAETETDFDYGDDAAPDPAILARNNAELDGLATRAERLIAVRTRLEAQLAEAKKNEEAITTKQIPELMQRMHTLKSVTPSGAEVAVKRDIKASLPGHDRVADRQRAFEWLVANGQGDVIKNVIRVSFERKEDAKAEELVAELRARGLTVECVKDVAPQTLSAIVREMRKAGKIVPIDCFNLFETKLARVVRT